MTAELTTAHPAPADPSDHELWYRACDFLESKTTLADRLEPRLFFIVVGAMVNSGAARQMAADGELPPLDEDDEAE